MKRNSYNTGIASEYLVLSQLYRLGHDAYMTLGNKKNIDIEVIYNNKRISIDVKAVQGYSSIIVNNVVPCDRHFLIVVIYNNKFEDVRSLPDIFIIPSLHVTEIRKNFKQEFRLFKSDILQYKDCWSLLQETN